MLLCLQHRQLQLARKPSESQPYFRRVMNKKQLAELLARQSHRSRGAAADTVDKLVYSIIKDLKDQDNAQKKDVQSTVKSRSKAPSSTPIPPALREKGQL